MTLFLHRMPSLILEGATLLHFAPEPFITDLLNKPHVYYVSADLARDDVDLTLNIENIGIGNEQCDVIVCSHVLEHVNDKLALSELHRILKPTGILIIMVPTNDGCNTTYEDDTIRDRNQRLIHFGDADHLRIYGADFIQRLGNAGFQVEVIAASGREAVKFGLIMGDKIFLARKKSYTPHSEIVT